MNADRLILAIPSKGRLMESAGKLFAGAGLDIRKAGHERGYRGEIAGFDDVEIAFLSANEIAQQLRTGRVHLGITGEDLIRETILDADARVEFLRPLGFGNADVVAAVPQCWIDIQRMSDLEEAGAIFHREHGRRLRVATKYPNLTRRHFATAGVAGYRIVESLGATEGTPAAGTAEMIVDITTTGTTLKANHLKVLEDGVILRSQAMLVASKAANWQGAAAALRQDVLSRLDAAGSKPAPKPRSRRPRKSG